MTRLSKTRHIRGDAKQPRDGAKCKDPFDKCYGHSPSSELWIDLQIWLLYFTSSAYQYDDVCIVPFDMQ